MHAYKVESVQTARPAVKSLSCNGAQQLVAEADGSMLRLVECDKDVQGQRTRELSWKECRLAAVTDQGKVVYAASFNGVRAAEAKRMKKEGYEEVLKNTKYCFAKNPQNLTDTHKTRLNDVIQNDLKSVKAYLLKEAFQVFWTYRSPYWAQLYLRKWCYRASRSKLEPIKKFVKSVRKHEHLIINFFRAKKALSSGIVEWLNRNVNLVTRKAYGYRTFSALQVSIYHSLGKLPEPELTHEFF